MIPFLPVSKYYSLFGIRLPIWGSIGGIGIIAFILLYILQIKKYKLPKKHAVISLIHFGFWTALGLHLFRIIFVSHMWTSLFQRRAGNDSAGIIFGLIALLIYLRHNKIKLGKYFDAITIPLMAVATICRIACMLIADEIGLITTVPWAIFYKDALRHPIGAYYFIVSLIILGILFYLSKKDLKSGNLFLSAAILYSSTRIMLDFIRVFPPHEYFGLSIHQVAYSLFLITSIWLFIKNNKKKFKKLYKSFNLK